MNTMKSDAVVRQLQWRYATKRFDASRQIPAGDWQTLEQSLVLSPSSYGLQPWKFFVISDPALRLELRKASWNQAQVTDASHLVVFAAKKNLDSRDVDRYLARIDEVRKVSVTSLEAFRGMMNSAIAAKGSDGVNEWSARQVYIALGAFMTTAAMMGIDTTPMEGFEPARYDEILGLHKQGYRAVVVAAAGYRSPDDAYAGQPKVRFATEELIARI